jgi:AcrR family transcriptional regulator
VTEAADAGGATPQRRGRPPLISEAAVIDAALRVTERVGLENLTMRLVAEELGMSMMAAYNYVPTKQALIARVVEAVLARVAVPERDAGSWDERMKMVGHDLRENVRRYPGIGDALRSTPAEAESLRIGRGVVGILTDGGFERDEAQAAFVTFYKFMIGQLRFDDVTSPVVPQPRTSFDPDALFDFGFETVLEGLRARLRRRRRSRRR